MKRKRRILLGIFNFWLKSERRNWCTFCVFIFFLLWWGLDESLVCIRGIEWNTCSGSGRSGKEKNKTKRRERKKDGKETGLSLINILRSVKISRRDHWIPPPMAAAQSVSSPTIIASAFIFIWTEFCFCYDFCNFLTFRWDVGNRSKQREPQVGKVSVSKPRVGNL